jgi:hypothetical protein
MDDLPPSITPRFWIAFGILCITFALAFVMAVYSSVDARAQEHAQICAPAEVLLRQFSETHKKRVIWQGVVPQETGRPIEIVLMQGEKNTWTMFTLTAGVACIVASGKDANPSLADKGI